MYINQIKIEIHDCKINFFYKIFHFIKYYFLLTSVDNIFIILIKWLLREVLD